MLLIFIASKNEEAKAKFKSVVLCDIIARELCHAEGWKVVARCVRKCPYCVISQ